jgi:hypothetical protein
MVYCSFTIVQSMRQRRFADNRRLVLPPSRLSIPSLSTRARLGTRANHTWVLPSLKRRVDGAASLGGLLLLALVVGKDGVDVVLLLGTLDGDALLSAVLLELGEIIALKVVEVQLVAGLGLIGLGGLLLLGGGGSGGGSLLLGSGGLLLGSSGLLLGGLGLLLALVARLLCRGLLGLVLLGRLLLLGGELLLVTLDGGVLLVTIEPGNDTLDQLLLGARDQQLIVLGKRLQLLDSIPKAREIIRESEDLIE